MSQSWVYEHTIGSINITVEHLGTHLAICISGGDVPHIGSVILSTPRPSLTGQGSSATSSVLNNIGHKDELVGRQAAEHLAAKLDTIVCCVCGIHKNDATPEDIASCATLGEELARFIFDHLSKNGQLNG